MNRLSNLNYSQLQSTRDYLREVALALGALQRGFLPAEPHLWQHGLEVNLRGPISQEFELGGEAVRASLDLVKYKVRFLEQKWPLPEFSPPEIWQALKMLVADQQTKFEEPEFKAGVSEFDTAQADAYAEALWWLDRQFRQIKDGLPGLTSPVLLYPHHFDLSLSWFPRRDERQLSLGWSTGDQTIAEPYLYLIMYPEAAGFKKLKLPSGAHWQADGFSAAVLLYKELSASVQPEQLFAHFADLLQAGAKLF